MRILGLDIGAKRIGVAVSDETGVIAQPLFYLEPEKGAEDLMKRIGEICRQYNVSTIVVGLPLSMDGGDRGSSSRRARKVGEKIRDDLGLTVIFQDERFTTRQAQRVLISSNMRRKKRKQNVDKIAASIILQGYLDAR